MFHSIRNDYIRLNPGWQDEDSDSFILEHDRKRRRQCSKWIILGLLMVSVLLNVIAAIYLRHIGMMHRADPFPQLLYSPANDVLEHKVVKFTRGLAGDVPIYEQPPSPAVDDAWFELYKYGPTKLSKSDADRLVNHTWPVFGDQDHYLTSLDVFHQLHCLDVIRQKIHPDSYDTHLPMDHMRHCVGVLRQAVMCFSDVSTIAWQWSDVHHEAEQRDDIPHTCRDFDRVRDWAKDHFYDTLESEDLEVYPDGTHSIQARSITHSI